MPLTKVTKAQVKAAIRNNGKWVGYLLPCKMNPRSVWMSSYMSDTWEFESIDSLDESVAKFEAYNCTNETGLYTSFYTKGDN